MSRCLRLTLRGLSLWPRWTSRPFFALFYLLFLLTLPITLYPIVVQSQTVPINSNVVIYGHVNYCSPTTASGTAYACNLGVAPGAYTTGARYAFKADVANTGAATINFSSLGAKSIVTVQGGITTPLVANDIRAGQMVELVYDGTNMQMVSPLGNAPAGGGGVTTDTAQRAAFYNTTTTVDGAPGLTFASDGTTITSTAERITTVSVTSTLGTADGPIIACTGGASDITLTLPAGATTTQRRLVVVKVDAGAGRCLVDANASETINGSTSTAAAATQWSRVDLTLAQTTGTPNWSAVFGQTNVPQVIASGTAALGTSAIASGACATTVTVAATGVVTTDVITWTPNADITAVTGYAPVTTGGLAIYPFPTAGNINFRTCNPTSASITPGAVSLNWHVIR